VIVNVSVLGSFIETTEGSEALPGLCKRWYIYFCSNFSMDASTECVFWCLSGL